MPQTTLVINGQDNASAAINSATKSLQSFAVGYDVLKQVLTATVSVLKDSINQYSQSQSVIAQTEAVLKSTGNAAGVTADQVKSLSEALQQQTTFSDDTIQSAQNLLLTFTKISSEVFPQATKTVLDMSQALGQDTKASAIQLGKALQDPIAGITALRRVGVNFTDSQKDMIQTLVDSGKTLDAQKLILQELQTEFGGSAEAASKTFGGSLATLKNNLENVQETAGSLIADLSGGFIATINSAAKAFLSMDEGTQKIILAMGGVAVAIPAIVIGIQGLSNAMKALGLTMAANPILLIATGAAVAATALAGVVANTIATNNSFKEMVKNSEGMNAQKKTFAEIDAQVKKNEESIAKYAEKFGFMTKAGEVDIKALSMTYEEYAKQYDEEGADVRGWKANRDEIQKLITLMPELKRQRDAANKTESNKKFYAESTEADKKYRETLTENVRKYTETVNEENGKQLENLAAKRDAELAKIKGSSAEEMQLRALILEDYTNKYQDELSKQEAATLAKVEAEKAAEASKAQAIMGFMSQAYSGLNSIVNQYYANEIAAADGNKEKLKQVKQEQFNAQKALSMGNIAMNTAQAVMSSYAAGGGFPLGLIPAGIMAAIGGAQLALVASQPMPAFARGGTMQNSGIALVGERGPEYVHLPGGAQIDSARQSKASRNVTINVGSVLAKNPIDFYNKMSKTAQVAELGRA